MIGNGTSILSAISRSRLATGSGSSVAASRNSFATSRRTHSKTDGTSVTEMETLLTGRTPFHFTPVVA